MRRSRAEDRIRRLRVAERMLLLEEMWDDIATEQASLEFTDGQRRELDRRLEADRASPGEGAWWEEVIKRLWAHK